jgi:hypothetical protein
MSLDNTLLGNLKTSFSGTFHAFNFDKYARRYLGGYCFRFNRRFSMSGMTERIANAVCCCMPLTERDLRVAEAYEYSRWVLRSEGLAPEAIRASMAPRFRCRYSS